MSPSTGERLSKHLLHTPYYTVQIPPHSTSPVSYKQLPRAPAVTRRVLEEGLLNHAIHVISAASYSHTSVNTLQYIKAGKKIKTGYVQSTSYSSLGHIRL